MKQKITLEIENDTGVEFEEEARLGVPKEGERYIFDGQIIKCDGGNIGTHLVLTPKVDKELEEAKKLIGKWVKFKDRDVSLKVRHVFRDKFSHNAICFEAVRIKDNNDKER